MTGVKVEELGGNGGEGDLVLATELRDGVDLLLPLGIDGDGEHVATAVLFHLRGGVEVEALVVIVLVTAH